MPTSTQVVFILRDGWSILFGFLGPIMTLATGIALGYFALNQNKINKRLKDLQDYVGLSIIPLNNLNIQITNVGRTNLYLHKWEVGENVENFEEPILISAEGKTTLIIALAPKTLGKKRAKFYLTDESREKFLSEGEVIIVPVSSTPIVSQVRLPNQESDNNVTGNPIVLGTEIKVTMAAYSYRTVPFNWLI
jgi:hypothetical protein